MRLILFFSFVVFVFSQGVIINHFDKLKCQPPSFEGEYVITLYFNFRFQIIHVFKIKFYILVIKHGQHSNLNVRQDVNLVKKLNISKIITVIT